MVEIFSAKLMPTLICEFLIFGFSYIIYALSLLIKKDRIMSLSIFEEFDILM